MEYFFTLNEFDCKIGERILISSFPFSFNCSCVFLGESGSGKTTLLETFNKKHCYDTNGTVLFCKMSNTNVSNWKEFLNFGKLSQEEQDFCVLFFQNRKRISCKCDLLKKVFAYPNFLFCDDCSFSREELKILLSFCERHHILFCYFTNCVEVIDVFPYIYVLKYGKVVVRGEMNLVLKEEKVMKKLGYSLPFYPNMSTQLKYYGLVSHLTFSKEELERELWK